MVGDDNDGGNAHDDGDTAHTMATVVDDDDNDDTHTHGDGGE